MHKGSQTWYFPILLLVGSLVLIGFSLGGCSSPGSHITPQCGLQKNCPNNPQTSSTIDSTGQTESTPSGTIVETPVSKTPTTAYLILSSSDSQDSGRIVPGGAQLNIQLIPQGKLINGHEGKTLSFNRIVNQDDIGLKPIPPGTYTVQISGSDPSGKKLSICLSYNDNQPAHSQVIALQSGLLGIEGQSATTLQLMMCPT
jgi:hypothetical protein